MAIDPVLVRFAARGAGTACDPRWSASEIERRRQPVVGEAIDAFMEGRRADLTDVEERAAACLARIAPTPQPPPPPNLFAEIARGFVGGSFQDGGSLEREVGHALSGFLGVGDLRDFAAHARRREWSAAGLDVVGLVPLAGDAVKGARRVGAVGDAVRAGERIPSPRSPRARLGLREQLMIESLRASFRAGELPVARVMAEGREITDLPRLLATYGGDPSDWQKVSSRHVHMDGVSYQGHWYVNRRTGQTDDFKVIPPERRS